MPVNTICSESSRNSNLRLLESPTTSSPSPVSVLENPVSMPATLGSKSTRPLLPQLLKDWSRWGGLGHKGSAPQGKLGASTTRGLTSGSNGSATAMETEV
ncbi:unnamed protein product [Prunus armeniaca]|uniref:Uncharacterized protein n=1 Tax=Prunus armeniaca TaxID=36596 RepID=A0A6J5Y045_PRUAR|nr:unnamed protein product [Prunus armeniaca]